QCTLREAIANLNAAADTTGGDCGAGTSAGMGDTITFNLPLPAVILLTTTTELTISGYVTISGPTTGVLAVDGNNSTRVFHILDGAFVRLADLTIQNGSAVDGGGILTSGD